MTELVRTFKTEAEWLAFRQKGVGSSDAAALLGLSPFSNALQLWAEKTGRVAPQASTLRLRVGRALEHLILDESQLRFGNSLRGLGLTTISNARIDGMFSTMDALVETPTTQDLLTNYILANGLANRFRELKTVSQYAKGWDLPSFIEGAPPPEPPLYVIAQVQHQYACCPAADEIKVIALFGLGENNDSGLLEYTIPRHYEIIRGIEVAVAKFNRDVETDTPPEVNSGDPFRTSEILGKLYPQSDANKAVSLPAATSECVDTLHASRRQIKKLDAQATELENAIKALMGEAEIAELADGRRITWKTQVAHRKAQEAKTVTSRVFRIPRDREIPE